MLVNIAALIKQTLFERSEEAPRSIGLLDLLGSLREGDDLKSEGIELRMK